MPQMTTNPENLPPSSSQVQDGEPRREIPISTSPFWSKIQAILIPLASLKITIASFLAAIFIVLVGTLAQVDDDIWKVVHDYFRVDFHKLLTSTFPFIHLNEMFVWVRPGLFFPPAFFPTGAPSFPDYVGIWFPKGWIIGLVMLVNLLAAHLVRFQVQAKGKRLVLGWAVIGLGALITLAVILSGSNPDGLQADPIIGYSTLWWLTESALFGLCAICVYAAIVAGKQHPERRWLFGILAVCLALTSLIATKGDGSDESTMRILYQVMKATFAGVVLLAGCLAVFKKRAGIVLLHAGIALMMSYDVLVGLEHVESQMHLMEGETTNFSRDMRHSEIAVIDKTDPKNEKVTVIGSDRFAGKGKVIDDPRLPFKIEVLDYYPNSTLLGPRQPVPEGMPAENPATEGMGKTVRTIPVRGSSGTDAGAKFDVPGAYLKITSKDGKDLGVYLGSAHLDLNMNETTDNVTVGDKTYGIALRFKRLYNDYTITLKDVQKNDYKGTTNPKDYSSFIELNDPVSGLKIDHRIWMNNPMRYAGKTFYQSGYSKLGDGEMTTLQVVDNAGWMTPYVACMMTVVGMMYHFGQTLLRYLNRRMRLTQQGLVAANKNATGDSSVKTLPSNDSIARYKRQQRTGTIVAASITLLVGTCLVYTAMPVREKPNEFNLAEFGKLPMWYKGRAMPLDTFARNTVMQLSDYQRYTNPEGKKRPAIEWLIAMMTDEEKARELRVIRIENEEVRRLIGLENREGMTYSAEELRPKIEKIFEQAQLATKTPSKERSLIQRKTIEVANRFVLYSFLERTLGNAPQLPKSDLPEDTPAASKIAMRAQQYFEYLRGTQNAITQFSEEFGLGPMPLTVPTHLGTEDIKRPNIPELNSKWETLTIAHIYDQFYSEFPAKTPPAVEQFIAILNAYKAGDVQKFNADLKTYQSFLAKHASAEDVPVERVAFEAWFDRVSAFNVSSYLYVFAGVLALFGWLFLPNIFQKSSFWLLVLIFTVHTLALLGRIYISGRPPVTNLYSSAVFIGWAVVLGGLIVEMLTKIGVGNFVAAISGFLTLRIAAGLAADGDTFVVLEAVLDTQFWLATHVVCIALGYATTYLAGMFGVVYIGMGLFTKRLTPAVSKELIRMIYGVLCFATFFSFWGTVLGGLWADDSWGRFWGWDPKENGALIIVLWNALILHVRWGKMTSDRGIAILSVLGNIVVSWSWFGVNELGVGLHSYGFTEGRLMYLGLFALSQLAISAIALIPLQYWRSSNQITEEATIPS